MVLRGTMVCAVGSHAGCGENASPVAPVAPAGALVYALHDCDACHATGQAPRLDGFGSAARTAAFLAHPDAPDFFGGTRHGGAMPAAKMDARRVERLAEWLVSGAPEGHPGARDFVKGGCGDCHTDPRPDVGALERHVGQTAPTLAGYGSPAWIEAFLLAPSEPAYFGEPGEGEVACPPRNAMPAAWRAAVSQWLSDGGPGPWETTRPPDGPAR